MKIAVPKEIRPGERRVAITPEAVAKLIKLGFEVLVESGAGDGAAFDNPLYVQAGARIVEGTRELWAEADLVLKVNPPEQHPKLGMHEADLMSEGKVLISFIWPAKADELIARLAAEKATVLAMDQVPRITRAQKMDALSSMANIAGYRAVIEAASYYGRFFTGQITAAGKVPAARVFVIGAGVAGLSAIGAARGLGAIVRAFDTRPAVREQVQSMGAEFVELKFDEAGEGVGGYAKEMSPAFIEAEMALIKKQAADSDIIITTALIPGRPAPLLVKEEAVNAMRRGSVIVDLAAETGGNCALTKPGHVIEHNGITIIGYSDLPSRLAPTASQLYGNNLLHLLADMGGAKAWHIDEGDEVVRGALVLLNGEKKWPPPKVQAPPAPPPIRKSLPAPAKPAPVAQDHAVRSGLFVLLAVLALLGLGSVAPSEFLSHFTVFVLAVFVGWQVVWNVTPALHTPLMSVTNAISGIIIVGGMLQVSGELSSPVTLLGAAAILLATINISGGFLVTQRMLKMFRR